MGALLQWRILRQSAGHVLLDACVLGLHAGHVLVCRCAVQLLGVSGRHGLQRLLRIELGVLRLVRRRILVVLGLGHVHCVRHRHVQHGTTGDRPRILHGVSGRHVPELGGTEWMHGVPCGNGVERQRRVQRGVLRDMQLRLLPGLDRPKLLLGVPGRHGVRRQCARHEQRRVRPVQSRLLLWCRRVVMLSVRGRHPLQRLRRHKQRVLRGLHAGHMVCGRCWNVHVVSRRLLLHGNRCHKQRHVRYLSGGDVVRHGLDGMHQLRCWNGLWLSRIPD